MANLAATLLGIGMVFGGCIAVEFVYGIPEPPAVAYPTLQTARTLIARRDYRPKNDPIRGRGLKGYPFYLRSQADLTQYASGAAPYCKIWSNNNAFDAWYASANKSIERLVPGRYEIDLSNAETNAYRIGIVCVGDGTIPFQDYLTTLPDPNPPQPTVKCDCHEVTKKPTVFYNNRLYDNAGK